MNFDFTTAGQIIFGPGSIQRLNDILPGYGKHIFLVVGYRGWEKSGVLELLTAYSPHINIYSIRDEPTIQTIEDASKIVTDTKAELVIGLGGGSALDTAKAVAAMATNIGPVSKYLEVIGDGLPLANRPLPIIGIPTTSGTGSEVTKNAVIGSHEHRVKVSMRHEYMIPEVVIIDPMLMLSMPKSVTASTGMDALTQLIEPFVSKNANPITDAISRDGIKRASKSLLEAYHHGNSVDARSDMALASLFGGIALANAKLGAVHGFAGPIGGMFDAPHGVICARLLPYVIRENITAIRQRDPDCRAIDRYKEIAKMLTGNRNAQLEDAADTIEHMVDAMDIPRLRYMGIVEDNFQAVIAKAKSSSSMKGNPIALEDFELINILQSAL